MSTKPEKTAAKAPPPPRTNKMQFAAAALDTTTEAPAVPELPVQRASAPSASYADINFKVPEDFKRRYRQAAAVMGMKLDEVLKESFELWLRENHLDDLRLPQGIETKDRR